MKRVWIVFAQYANGTWFTAGVFSSETLATIYADKCFALNFPTKIENHGVDFYA